MHVILTLYPCLSGVSWLEHGGKPYTRHQHFSSTICGSEVIQLINRLPLSWTPSWIQGDFYYVTLDPFGSFLCKNQISVLNFSILPKTRGLYINRTNVLLILLFTNIMHVEMSA